jgi:hypothetical protein
MIATVAVLGVAIYIAIGVLTVMGASEYIVELAIAMFSSRSWWARTCSLLRRKSSVRSATPSR